jgi:tungstate transport system ATP-binding protein
MTPILEVQHLKMRRDGHTVLEVEHLSLQQGEVLALIGPNGAGKSTLLLTLARLLKPDEGRLLFKGQALERQGELAYRRRLALVLQEPLLLDCSVFDNVAAGLRYRRLPRTEVEARVDMWLSRLGIAHLRRKAARRLSGGEAQRVSLARAFVLQPEILLLDEPFAALDAPTRARLRDDLQALLRETAITTVFVTHDLDEALQLGHRVGVLIGGRLRQAGAPQEVFNAPADEEVAAFVGVETVVAGQVMAAEEGRLIVAAHGLRLEAVGDYEVGRSVLLCLRPEDVTLLAADGSTPSSARNRLPGRILRLTPQGPLVKVTLDCGFRLVALVTRASAQALDLDEGRPITAAFKASAVHLIPR